MRPCATVPKWAAQGQRGPQRQVGPIRSPGGRIVKGLWERRRRSPRGRVIREADEPVRVRHSLRPPHRLVWLLAPNGPLWDTERLLGTCFASRWTPCGIMLSVDDQARRITARVLDCLAGYEAGEASTADLQSAVSAAAMALDGANANLRDVLERLDQDLEQITFTVLAADQPVAVARAFEDFRDLATRS